MATESASSVNQPRPMWQVPLFLVGLASIVGVWFAQPSLRLSPPERFARELASLKQMLERGSPDSGKIEKLISRLEASPVPKPQESLLDWYLGSAYLALADAKKSDSKNESYWSKARNLLEKLNPELLTTSDQNRRNYRLARIWARDGDIDPIKLIAMLQTSAQIGDDPAEGYRLLALQYLRLNPPNKIKARDGLQDYLARALPRTDPQILAETRLQLGSLCLELGGGDEAKKVLERIGPDGSPEIYTRSRLLLAKVAQQESGWQGSVAILEKLLERKDVPEAMRPVVELHFALACLTGERAEEGLRLLDQLQQQNSGPIADAAVLRGAEFLNREPTHRKQVGKLLEGALPSIENPKQFVNPHISLGETRALFEDVVASFRKEGNYEDALKILENYRRIAEPGKDRERIAEVYELWADATTREAIKNTTQRDTLLAVARDRYQAAVSELTRLSSQTGTVTSSEDLQKRASLILTKASDPIKSMRAADSGGATAVVIKSKSNDSENPAIINPMAVMPKVNVITDGEAKLREAQTLYEGGQRDAALKIYESQVKISGPMQNHFRLKLAIALIETNQTDNLPQAQSLLEQALMNQGETSTDLHEQLLYSLGLVHYRKKEWTQADARYTEAIQYYPQSLRATEARLVRGYCQWFLASREADKLKLIERQIKDPALTAIERTNLEMRRKSADEQFSKSLRAAIVAFQELEDRLLPKFLAGELKGKDALYFKNGSFRLASCLFFLGEYEESIRRYLVFVERYQGQVDELNALSQLWQCYSRIKDGDEKAAEMIRRLKAAFKNLKDSDFDRSAPERSKDFWEKWIQNVEANPTVLR
jgi:tetratricopeptide (TPR) repeat protein